MSLIAQRTPGHKRQTDVNGHGEKIWGQSGGIADGPADGPARSEGAGWACSDDALVTPFTTCAAQTACWAVTLPLCSSVKPCPT